MALTWVIADVLGNGSPPQPPRLASDSTGPFRPAGGDLGSFRALIAPGIARCLMLSEADPALLAANGRLDVLPVDLLDSVIPANRVNQVNNALGRRGFTTTAYSGETYRELLIAVAHEIDPTFDFGWWPGADPGA